MMRIPKALVLAASLVLVAGVSGGDATKELQGSWKVVRLEEKGRAAPEAVVKTLSVKVEGDTMSLLERDVVVTRLAFKLDPSRAPKAIDFTYLDGPDKGKVEWGIYERAGTKLTLCVGDSGKNRPKTFATAADSNAGLIVLERAD